MERKYFQNEINKKNIIIYSIIGLIFILAIVGYVLYSNNIQEPEIAKLEEDSSSISTEEGNLKSSYEQTETASSEIGKTINEAEKELETVKKKEEVKSEKVKKEETKKETENTNVEEKNINEEVKAELKFIKPVEGEIVNKFAKENLIYSKTLGEWVTHQGIDIKADKTSVVQASEEGTVKSIKTDPRYGLTVIISHNDEYETVYSNLLTAEFVVEGEKIEKGQTVGTIGNSGAFEVGEDYHLHFEIIKNGENVDPEMYL